MSFLSRRDVCTNTILYISMVLFEEKALYYNWSTGGEAWGNAPVRTAQLEHPTRTRKRQLRRLFCCIAAVFSLLYPTFLKYRKVERSGPP